MKIKKTNRELAENVALGFCLSECAEGLSYADIVEKLVCDDIEYDAEGYADIVVAKPFEGEDVVALMAELVNDIERTLNFKDLLNAESNR